MAERGLQLDHSTIARWVLRYSPVLNERIRSQMRRPSFLAGRRNVRSGGGTLDLLIPGHRFSREHNRFPALTKTRPGSRQRPSSLDGSTGWRVINVDGHPAYPAAIDQHKPAGELGNNCRCRRAPYLNNIIELDHRFVTKRPGDELSLAENISLRQPSDCG